MDKFEFYFKLADSDHDGRISSTEAVSFFKASALPMPVLSQGGNHFPLWEGRATKAKKLLQGGNHFALWEDPFKKPCYIFALVARQLESRDDTFTTCSGRKVALKIWTPPKDLPKTEHAMYSLKAAMK